MKDRLAAVRRGQRPKVTQAQLAAAIGVSPQAVSGWERGEATPEPENLRKIAKFFSISVDWLLEGDESLRHLESSDVASSIGQRPDIRSEDVAASLPSKRQRTVKLKGYVGASGEAFYYRLADEDLEEVPAPENVNDQTVAVEVRGKSLGAAFESWLVYYDDVRSPITADLHNHLCVVGLADDRLLVKRLERRRGKFVLISNNGEPDIEDAEIEWAAKVTSMRPR